MSESLADLAMVLERTSAPGKSPMGRLYAATWEEPARVRGPRLRLRLAAGLLAVARRLSPEVIEARLSPPARTATEGTTPA